MVGSTLLIQVDSGRKITGCASRNLQVAVPKSVEIPVLEESRLFHTSFCFTHHVFFPASSETAIPIKRMMPHAVKNVSQDSQNRLIDLSMVGYIIYLYLCTNWYNGGGILIIDVLPIDCLMAGEAWASINEKTSKIIHIRYLYH